MEKNNISTWDSFSAGAKQFLNDVVFQYVPKLIVAVIVLFVGWKLINLLNRVMKRAYDRHKVDPSLQQFLHSVIDIILKVLLVLTAMGIMGIQMTSFIAILGAAGVAIGMGLQGTLQNFAGGVIILLLKPFKVGDYIEQGSYAGFVEGIQIFNTTLRTYDARKIIVPNTELATKSLVNHFNLPQRRIAIPIGVAYGESVDKAKEVLLKVANANPQVLQEPKPPFATLEKFGDSSLNMTLYAWTLPENYWTTLYSLNEEVYAAFRREGIEIPFNQMDVHIRKEE
ncbi:MAG: mechanosensitive ion channel family protein [Bacteroidales bacterium]|mgnify:FL=1|jgi:small conductance mechanosensitive channel|nr:mechanosensitive ion channel family protein [Bacteroidales bacterium]MBR3571898.1 mechanosensitive ion channel family protein [Bacteroidales bacterium]